MRIMIIGGTSGIGLALAEHYAARGDQLALCGRDLGRLDGHALRRHAAVRCYQFDIGDSAALTRAVADFGGEGLDLLIVSAALYVDAAGLRAHPEQGLAMVRTNIDGLSRAFGAGAAVMRAHGRGHMVAITSIAGLLKNYPSGSLYSATKRAALALCDVYRKALAPFGIDVTAIVPGYVDTARLRELNGGDASAKPFLLTEADAVARTTAAIARRAEQVVFPRRLHLLVKAFNCLPLALQTFRKK